MDSILRRCDHYRGTIALMFYPALLRPGRFDRQITVNLPDVKGREEILRVHAKRVQIGGRRDLGRRGARYARLLRGPSWRMSLNEAALLAPAWPQSITMAELEGPRQGDG